MISSCTIKLSLPFDHVLVAFVCDDHGSEFAIIRRDGPQPYVTYRLDFQTDGCPSPRSCSHGAYLDTRKQAWTNLLSRASFFK